MGSEILKGLNPNQRFWSIIKIGILISLVEAFAQTNIKNKNAVNGIIGYIIIVFILYSAYDYEGFGHMNLVWSCVSIIFCFTIGHMYYDEPMNGYTVSAIVFALIAIYLAHRSDEV